MRLYCMLPAAASVPEGACLPAYTAIVADGQIRIKLQGNGQGPASYCHLCLVMEDTIQTAPVVEGSPPLTPPTDSCPAHCSVV